MARKSPRATAVAAMMRRLQANTVGVEFSRLAAADQADIVGKFVLRQLAAELVKDARQLIDRAVIAGANPRRMSASAGHGHHPAPGAATRDRAHVDRAAGAVFLRQVLEI